MHWHFNDPQKHETVRVMLDHIKTRVAKWPKQDVQDSLSEVMLDQLVRRHSQRSPSDPVANFLLSLTGVTPTWSTPIAQDGHTLPFDVAWAIRSVTAPDYNRCDLPLDAWETRAETILPGGASAAAFRALSQSRTGPKDWPEKVKEHPGGLSDLLLAARFIVSSSVTHLATEVSADTDHRLVSMVQALLAPSTEPNEKDIQAQSLLVEDYSSFLHSPRSIKRHEKLCSSSAPLWMSVKPIATWLQQNPTAGDILRRGVWGCRVLASTVKPGDPLPREKDLDAARSAVMRAVQADAEALKSACGLQWGQAMAINPQLSRLVEAAASASELTQSLPNKKKSAAPRAPRM